MEPSSKSEPGHGPWDPQQYERFQAERTQPFFDLLQLVQKAPGMRVADLGCGTGELTRHLHRHLQAQETVGIDSSESMLARSWAFAGDGLRFRCEDIANLRAPGHYDLLFSNAALHWLPGHAQLLRRLTDSLAEGGQLAIQMPAHGDHPSHRVAAEVAAEPPFREALAQGAPPGPARKVLAPWEYAAILDRLGFRQQRVELRVYGHHLASRDEVVEWVKGSLLTEYKGRLPAPLYDRFVARYREALLPQLDDTRPYFYPFQRLLLWARR